MKRKSVSIKGNPNFLKFEDFLIDPNWSDTQIDQYREFHDDIWINNEYARYGIDVEKNDIVLDMGASIGLFTRNALLKGAKKVIAFEANNSVFNYLVKNTEKFKKVVPVNATVTHRTVVVADERLSKETYDLEKIYDTFNLQEVDFLKMDVEGCEFGLIINASNEQIQRSKKWVIELHVCKFFASLEQEYELVLMIIEKFSTNGFKCYMEKTRKNTCCFMLYAIKE